MPAAPPQSRPSARCSSHRRSRCSANDRLHPLILLRSLSLPSHPRPSQHAVTLLALGRRRLSWRTASNVTRRAVFVPGATPRRRRANRITRLWPGLGDACGFEARRRDGPKRIGICRLERGQLSIKRLGKCRHEEWSREGGLPLSGRVPGSASGDFWLLRLPVWPISHICEPVV